MASGSPPLTTPVVTLAQTGTVPASGLPVGLSWVSGGEHLLFTSASQVILYSVHDGARVREWSFRPTKSLNFTLAVLAASTQGLLVGVQDCRKLVAWSDKGATLTTPVGVATAGPEGLCSVEVPFAVAQLELSTSGGVAWCMGEKVPGQVACYSIAGEATTSVLLLAVASAAPSTAAPAAAAATISSCLAHPKKRVLLVVADDGSLHLFRCADGVAVVGGNTADSLTVVSLQNKLMVTANEEATLQSSGMMWSGAREDTAYVWTVWAKPQGGGLVLRMARVSFDQQDTLTLLELFSTALDDSSSSSASSSSADAGASTQKRRRASSSPASSTSPNVHTVGMAAEGLLVTAVQGEQGVRLQAWDAEFGVVVGEAVSSSLTAGPSSVLVGGKGVMASASKGSSSDVAVWRVEATDRPSAGDVGLRRVLGKLSALVPAPSVAAVMTFKRGGEGWVVKDGREDEVQCDQSGDAVEELLKLLPKGQEQEGKGAVAADKKNSSSKKRKRSKDAAVVAPTLVSAQTALQVATLCLSSEEEDVSSPAPGGAKDGGKKSRGRKSTSGSENDSASRNKALWRLLQALLEAGKFPLRERPNLMLELLARGRKDLVASVLAGSADVPEKAMVQVVSRLVRPSMKAKEQDQAAKEVVELVGLAVRRPCCPAFLRAAMATELDGPAAALLLVLLRALLERAMDKGARTKPTEEQVLTWLEALLDAKFVSMVLEGTRAPAAGEEEQELGTGALLQQILGSVKDVAAEAARACQALEVVDGYFSQFKRAGVHGIQVIPDYSLDAIVI